MSEFIKSLIPDIKNFLNNFSVIFLTFFFLDVVFFRFNIEKKIYFILTTYDNKLVFLFFLFFIFSMPIISKIISQIIFNNYKGTYCENDSYCEFLRKKVINILRNKNIINSDKISDYDLFLILSKVYGFKGKSVVSDQVLIINAYISILTGIVIFVLTAYLIESNSILIVIFFSVLIFLFISILGYIVLEELIISKFITRNKVLYVKFLEKNK